jgi:hypothetical protein
MCVLLLTSISIVHAQNHLYVTGSTAYRNPVEHALLAQFDAGVVYGYDGGSFGGQHDSIYSGTIGGVAWIIATSWSGSEAGIQVVSGGLTIPFLNDNQIAVCTTSGNGALRNVTGDTSAQSDSVFSTADMAMSDTLQSASEFQGLFHSVNYPALTEATNSPVGINVFKFIANKASSLTAVTSQQLRKLYAAGKLPLAFFTGNNADEVSTVYATGRNPDSGTRVTALLESGVGTALTSVINYQPFNGSTGLQGSGTVTNLNPYPAGTVNGISITTGNNGYSSGGNLVKSLNSDFTNAGAGVTASGHLYNVTPSNGHSLSMVGYASSNDADGQIYNSDGTLKGGPVELSYNGVKVGFSTDYNTNTLLTEGQYTFWSKEHVYPGLSEDATHLTLINVIATTIPNQTGAVKLSSMKVTRAADGGVVAAGYTVF